MVAALTPMIVAVLMLACCAVDAVSAHAEAFGEITKVGSFGTGVGQFSYPSDLAVDPSDNSVYVLDEPGGRERDLRAAAFRIQKLSADLTPEASLTILTPEVSGHRQLVDGIAVDPVLHRLYVLKAIETSPVSSPSRFVASQILAFSTIEEEVGGVKVLPPASEVKTNDQEGVFYEFPAVTEPLPAGTLRAPHGLAVDPVASGPLAHSLLVLGMDEGENTVLQQIGSTGPSYATGTPGESFDDTTESLSPREHSASGIAFGPEGSIYVSGDLKTSNANLPGVARLSGSLAAPTISVVHQDVGTSSEPHALTGGNPELGIRDVGAQLAVSPDGSLVYAFQVSNVGEASSNVPGSYEVRGMSTEAGPKLGSQQVVFGGGSSSCLIATEYNAVAAGSGGFVYALDEGDDFENPVTEEFEHTSFGFDVVEFGPGGHGCPTPSASFDINGKPSPGVTVDLEKGQPVALEALGPPLNGETPVELKWEVSGGPEPFTETVTGTGARELKTPVRKYLKPGTYAVTLKVTLESNGAYGNPPPVTGTLVVEQTPPTAGFEASTLTPKPNEAVTFNGAESLDSEGECSPATGCKATHKLEKYEWSFGDGTSETTTAPEYARSFSNSSTEARPESVTLVVVNEEGVQSAPSAQMLTIQGTPSGGSPPPPPPPPPSGGGGPPPATPSIVPPPIVQPPITPPTVKPKPLTNVQKLALAIKKCKKIKSMKPRMSCEKLAKEKYAPKKKAKKK